MLVGKGAQRGGGDNGAFLSVIATAVLAGMLWLPGALLNGFPSLAGHAEGLGWFALSGLLTIILGRSFFYASIAKLGAIRASAVSRLTPFFSAGLAALLLNEAVTPLGAVGMTLIGLGFALLVSGMLRDGARRHAAAPSGPAGYIFGPVSSLCYASGLVARKLGLLDLPDASLGTFVGAATALAVSLALALVSARHRSAVTGLVTSTTRWHVFSALTISIGQLSQFKAIQLIEVSRVAMINTSEVAFTLILSTWVLRTERRPTAVTLLAALLAAGGAVLIAVG